MDIFIGLDIGTSKLSCVALGDSGKLLGSASRVNDTDVAGLPLGRHEQDPDRIFSLSIELLHDVSEALGSDAGSVCAIGLTGQMHGVVLADDALEPVTNLITWRDARANEQFGGSGRTFLAELCARGGDGAFADTGTQPATGFMGATLFHFAAGDGIPTSAKWALQIHDWVAAKLAGAAPVTDPSDAASTGLFNVRECRWHEELVGKLSIDPKLLAQGVESGTELGLIKPEIGLAAELPANVTIHGALGDNQASALASMREPFSEILLNIGTGGQISAVTDRFFTAPGIESRPFPGGRFLSVGASLCGGGAFVYLADNYIQAIKALTGTDVLREDVLTKLTEMAENIPSGADGLAVEPLFAGKRHEPGLRGSMSGMSAANNTPGHWARAFMEGLVAELAGSYRDMLAAGLDQRRRVVASGNGMRKNAILRRSALSQLEMPLALPAWREEAACGAALAAMVGKGAVGSFNEAAKFVRYETDSALFNKCV